MGDKMELNLIDVEAVDILVVGSGIAGLIATDQALKASNKVCLSTTGKLCGGASFFPHKSNIRNTSYRERYFR